MSSKTLELYTPVVQHTEKLLSKEVKVLSAKNTKHLVIIDIGSTLVNEDAGRSSHHISSDHSLSMTLEQSTLPYYSFNS